MSPSRSTGARGGIVVRGRRRPSVSPLTLTAAWRLSLTRTALLCQHIVSPWVCLSSHQSLLCHFTHNADVYEQSLRVALYSHVNSRYKPGLENYFCESCREREREGRFSLNGVRSICFGLNTWTVGWGTNMKKKTRWELFLCLHLWCICHKVD